MFPLWMPSDERLAITVGAGKLDIDPGFESNSGRPYPVLGEMVIAGELANGEVVRHHGPLEPPLVSKDVGEELAMGAAGDPVELVIGVHDRPRPGADHRLERMEVHLPQLAVRQMGRRPVEAAL